MGPEGYLKQKEMHYDKFQYHDTHDRAVGSSGP
jgi:hypothetical protein